MFYGCMDVQCLDGWKNDILWKSSACRLVRRLAGWSIGLGRTFGRSVDNLAGPGWPGLADRRPRGRLSPTSTNGNNLKQVQTSRQWESLKTNGNIRLTILAQTMLTQTFTGRRIGRRRLLWRRRRPESPRTCRHRQTAQKQCPTLGFNIFRNLW